MREILVNLDFDQTYDSVDRAAAIGNYAELVATGKTPSGLIYQGSATTFEDATGVSAEQPMASQDLSVASHIDEYYKQMDVYSI